MIRALANPLIFPYSGLVGTTLELLRLTLLKRLKNSARNWKSDSFQAGVLEPGEVGVDQSRTDQYVPARVAVRHPCMHLCERSRIEELMDLLGAASAAAEAGLPMVLGRFEKVPSRLESTPEVTVNGWPVLG
jgi:hypothetical protein